MPGRKNKIFGIGLAKTGTTSLTGALRILGYRCSHDADKITELMGANLSARNGRLLKGIDEDFDAFTDGPLRYHFPMLDENYPQAKFICTVRDLDTWLRSMEAHNRRHAELIGQPPTIYKERWINRYHWHQALVLSYFAQTPDRVLTMNITAGDGWELLCPFLDKPVPDQPFPWRNKDPKS